MNSSLLQFFMPKSDATGDYASDLPSAYATSQTTSVELPPVDPTIPSTEWQPETEVEYSDPIEISNVYVNVESMDQVNADESSTDVAFDLIFNVFWTESDSTGQHSKNGKVKRRIAINKDKLRAEASQVIPIVLEDKQKVAENKEKLMNSIRVLAGVSGNKTFV